MSHGVPVGGGPEHRLPGARSALALLLTVNLFNYIDRQILSAVLPLLEEDGDLFDPTDRWLGVKLGLLTSAFLVSYTIFSPIFGWLGDRTRRWFIVGFGVTVWSLASGSSGLATGYVVLLLTRCLVGIGEAAYGPVAPAMLSDMYPEKVRGRIISYFYLAIPVGSALGFVIGGQMGEHFGWRHAFLVTFVGLVPAAVCFFMREPPRPHAAPVIPAAPEPVATPPAAPPAHSFRATLREYWAVVRELRTVRSFVLCCAGMTCTTFMLGGVAAWTPRYIFQREARFEVTDAALEKLRTEKNTQGVLLVPAGVTEKVAPLAGAGVKTYPAFKAELLERLGKDDLQQYGTRVYRAATTSESMSLGKVNFLFGAIVVVSGLVATLLGGIAGDRLRDRGVRGAYFHAAGWTTLLAWPFFAAVMFVPFPLAWGFLFVAVFLLFFNTGPANTILVNVTRPEIRATAIAVNILIIHVLGDVLSPPLIGLIEGFSDLGTAFLVVSFAIPAGGLLWVLGAKHLDEDTRRAGA